MANFTDRSEILRFAREKSVAVSRDSSDDPTSDLPNRLRLEIGVRQIQSRPEQLGPDVVGITRGFVRRVAR